VILDTNALSAFVDGNAAVAEKLAAEGRAAIPVMVLGEFRYGIASSRHRSTYESWLGEHLPDFEILPVTEETTFVYARVRAALKEAGRPIPANDVWIAALAVQHRLAVLSRDQHFDHVPDVKRINW
jgi:tRNA(fMet)-specific endonuclease VapC